MAAAAAAVADEGEASDDDDDVVEEDGAVFTILRLVTDVLEKIRSSGRISLPEVAPADEVVVERRRVDGVIAAADVW